MEYIGITKNEIKELTETLLNSFFKHIDTKEIICVDIDGLASFFDLTVRYENIAEIDKNKIAFFSDGNKPLCIYKNGTAQMICFPPKTIVIDNYLRQISMSDKRRYAVAHEVGHYILKLYGYEPSVMQSNSEYEIVGDCSLSEIKRLMNYNEKTANEIGAFLLMPEFLVQDYVHELFESDKIPIYGEYMLKLETKRKIKLISDKLGVSYDELMIQLKRNNMFLHLPAETFFMEGIV